MYGNTTRTASQQLSNVDNRFGEQQLVSEGQMYCFSYSASAASFFRGLRILRIVFHSLRSLSRRATLYHLTIQPRLPHRRPRSKCIAILKAQTLVLHRYRCRPGPDPAIFSIPSLSSVFMMKPIRTSTNKETAIVMNLSVVIVIQVLLIRVSTET